VERTLTENAPDASGAGAPTERKKLIFFVATDPAVDPGPFETAKWWATVAAEAGLDAEVRLAAQAVRGVGAGLVGTPPDGVFLSVCPRAMAKYGVTGEQVDAVGGHPRTLAEILTEVAEGKSVLIPITHRIDDASGS
jgi:hypothetical protein